MDVLVVQYETSTRERFAALLHHPLALPCVTFAALSTWYIDSFADAFVLLGSSYVARRISQPWSPANRR